MILQDPLAFDQASQPLLRSSFELSPNALPTLERENARQLWESLSLDPEVAQERQNERKRLLMRADTLMRESAAAKAEVLALQAQLAKEQSDRFHHPLIYAGAVAVLGLGVMWAIERRHRLRLEKQQDRPDASKPIVSSHHPSRQQEQAEEHDSDYSLEDSPDLAKDFSTDLSGQPQQKTKEKIHPSASASASAEPTPAWAQAKPLQDLPNDDELLVMLQAQQRASLMARVKRRLGHMFQKQRVAQQETSTQASTEVVSTQGLSQLEFSTQPDPEEMQTDGDRGEGKASPKTVAPKAGLNDTTTDSKKHSDEQILKKKSAHQSSSLMEQLLELRTAVKGLKALGRLPAAAKILREHLNANPDTCTWAYVEYMYLCELIDHRDDFEVIRKRYRSQFNRMAPYWQEPNSYVVGLDGYARAASELCMLWRQDKEVVRSTLSSWLIGPLLGRKLVQLPAYHDLFDLYEMLDYLDDSTDVAMVSSNSAMGLKNLVSKTQAADELQNRTDMPEAPELDFLPTVSLLDLDYEFSSDVTLEQHDVDQSEKAVTIVKPGHFSVDFNVAGTEIGGLFSQPSELDKK